MNELSKKLGKALLPHTESIDESMDDVWKDYESIEKFLEKNNYTNYDLMDYNEYPMSTSKISIRVDGDWKHDHLYFQDIIEEWAKENNRDIFKIDKDVEPSDSDWYAATYHIYVTKDKDSLDKLNSMRRLFASESLDESLLQDLQDDFSMARKNWDKLGLGIDFDSALEKWNDESELSEKETFYSKPIYSEDAWEDMVSMFSKNESLKEGDSRTIYSVEPRQSKSGLWEIVQVDTGNLAHTKRFYDKESCEKFIRRNARYNNWFVMYNKDFRKDLETKEPTEFGKVLQKQLGESLQSTNTKINIRESLNKIDWDTDNKYDLRNMYDASKMEYKDKIELAKMISLNESYENLYSCLKKFI